MTPMNRTLPALLGLALLCACSGTSNRASESQTSTAEKKNVTFTKHVLTRDFISEGVAVGDVNKDGKIDVMAGAYWFAAPDWKRSEIFPGQTFDGAKGYSNSFLNFSMDVNQDGWIDLIVIDFPGTPAYWYENPQNKEGHWPKHLIHESVHFGNESPALVDVDGDGRLDLLSADTKERQIVWLKAPVDGGTSWQKFEVSEKNAPGTERFSHGLGLGDINKDGRNDILVKEGWWEAPEDRTQSGWTFHPASLGEDCSHMHVLDIDGDGLNDVLTASAHRYGIWWYQQAKTGEETSWTQHEISRAFSQSHASSLADIDGDGDPDLVIGKRFFAHNDTDNDPGGHDPAVLYWFEFTPGVSPYFTPHEVDDDSGVGLNIVTRDITGDGLIDIVIGNKKGVFIFEQQ